MNRFHVPAALLVVAASVSSASADDKPLKGDLAKFQGKWSAKIGPDKNIPMTVVFDGNAVKVHLITPNGDQVDFTCEIKLDEAANPHKAIDWVKFKFSNGEEVADRPGIYTFEDASTLKFCTAPVNGSRPTEFAPEGGGDDGPSTVVFKREGDQPKPKTEETKDKDAPAPKGDLAKLQGEWSAKLGPEMNVLVELTFKGHVVTFSITPPDGEKRTFKGEAKLDEAGKPHKTIDWVKFSGPDGGEAPANLGIYKLEGDTFTVCNGGPGNERPGEFKAGEGGPPHLLALTRKAGK